MLTSGRLERTSLEKATALGLKSFESLVRVDLLVKAGSDGKVIEPRFVTVNALPPNMRMELTVLLGTRLARRRARRSPSTPAAHPGR